MKPLFATLRDKFFSEILNEIPKINAQFVIITHLLEDRPELLLAFSKIAPIALLIGIPYSVDQSTLKIVKNDYTVSIPTLDELKNKKYLNDLVLSNIRQDVPVIFVEIGGYFSSLLTQSKQTLGYNVLGAIEDTETGHREYLKLESQLCYPVVSVARSELKEKEDFLVGASCIYSVEKLLRENGLPIEGKNSVVLGFGKVGRGIAHTLNKRSCPVFVYDTNIHRRINALSEGFLIPEKKYALNEAEIIYGATAAYSLKAEDFKQIKNGALLVSCSSKDIEFDLDFLSKNYKKQRVCSGLDCYTNEINHFYLAANGEPINFRDGAVIGPTLALVQSEILLAIKQLIELKDQAGLFMPNRNSALLAAQKWLDYFCDATSGRFKLSALEKEDK